MNNYGPLFAGIPRPIVQPKKIRKFFNAEEDALLSQIMSEQPFTTWIDVATQIPGRSARQCRDRWANYLSPENKNGPWTQDEDVLLTDKFRELGPQWTAIAKFFDGRSENNVKNRWYTHLRSGKEAPTMAKTPEPIALVGKTFIPATVTPTHERLPPISTLEVNAPRLAIDGVAPQLFQSMKLRSASAQPYATYR